MNHTNLSHITVTIKILLAMKQAIKDSLTLGYGVAYIYNRKGKAFLRVNYTRNSPNAFQFWEGKTQANITDTVLSVLRTEV